MSTKYGGHYSVQWTPIVQLIVQTATLMKWKINLTNAILPLMPLAGEREKEKKHRGQRM